MEGIEIISSENVEQMEQLVDSLFREADIQDPIRSNGMSANIVGMKQMISTLVDNQNKLRALTKIHENFIKTSEKHGPELKELRAQKTTMNQNAEQAIRLNLISEERDYLRKVVAHTRTGDVV
jgi:hypothetical protein